MQRGHAEARRSQLLSALQVGRLEERLEELPAPRSVETRMRAVELARTGLGAEKEAGENFRWRHEDETPERDEADAIAPQCRASMLPPF